MSRNRLHVVAVLGWFVVLGASLSVRVALGPVPISAGEGLAWLLFGATPVLILRLVFRGAPPPTIAEVLYDADHGSASVGASPPTRDGRHAARS